MWQEKAKQSKARLFLRPRQLSVRLCTSSCSREMKRVGVRPRALASCVSPEGALPCSLAPGHPGGLQTQTGPQQAAWSAPALLPLARLLCGFPKAEFAGWTHFVARSVGAYVSMDLGTGSFAVQVQFLRQFNGCENTVAVSMRQRETQRRHSARPLPCEERVRSV